MLTCLGGAALRLTGKHWECGLTAGRRRTVAARDLADGGPDVIRKEARSFYRIISGVRLCWELEEPKGPKRSGLRVGLACSAALQRQPRAVSMSRGESSIGPDVATMY